MTTPSGRTQAPWLLEARNVTKRFGGLTAVKALTINVAQGALYGLIGPNGAGKTTVFNLLTGQYDPTEGEIHFDGTRLDGKKPYQIAKLGVARTFQNIRLFADMTVLENVLAAHHLRTRQVLADAVLGTGRHHAEEREMSERAMKLLTIFDLDGVADEYATSLPYGSQRRLEIARALATGPKLLLLDEPAAGMNPQEALDLMRLIQLAARRVPDHHPARRAQHEGRDGHLRDDSGDRLRRGDRHRPSPRDPAESEGDRGLSWRGINLKLGSRLTAET